MLKEYTSKDYGSIKLYFSGKYVVEKQQGATLTIVKTSSEKIALDEYKKLSISIIAHDQY